MAKLSDLKRVTKDVDVSEFFDGDDAVVFSVRYFDKESETEISAAQLEGRKMDIDPATKGLKMDAANFVLDPVQQAKVFALEIFNGVEVSPLDEEWTIDTVNQLRKVSPGAATKIHKAVTDLNRPTLPTS